MDSIEQTAPEMELKSPFCCEIRSKKTFTLATVPVKESDVLDPSGHCWCRLTMQVVGPDGGFVSPKHCGPDRGCYKSHFR
jgi:hypothetical protein